MSKRANLDEFSILNNGPKSSKKRLRNFIDDSNVDVLKDPEPVKRRRLESNDDDDLFSLIPENIAQTIDMNAPIDRSHDNITSQLAKKLGYREHAPYNQDWIHISTLSGSILYATIEPEESGFEPSNTYSSHLKYRGNLLEMSIDEIKSLVEEETRFELWKSQQASNSTEPRINTSGTKLWVDKYCPKTFNDLLSDEKVNRNVLIWFKQWSGCVFGKPFQNPLTSGRNAPGGSASNYIDKGHRSNHQDSNHKNSTQKDPIDRPEARCILISGPPGIGKTTLAHVISRAAGFEPIEFNASDDRTAGKFIPKVMDVVGTESMFGSGTPKALIIDEIDGVAGGEGKGAIDALVKILDERDPNSNQSNSNQSNSNQSDSSDANRTSQKKVFKLKRPIICICNDLWAPALRPLRDRALLFKLDPPSRNNLVSRLQAICLKEGVIIERNVLEVLCEMTNRDVRACLNTLQFLSRKSNHITIDLFTSTSFGNKDMVNNIFEVWRQIFLKGEERSSALQSVLEAAMRLKRFQQGNKSAASKDSMTESLEKSKELKFPSDIERIQHMTKGGNMDKILDGIFENYLAVKYHDPLMNHTVATLDWFSFYDQIQTAINSKQLFTLFTYIPYVASGVHHNCSTTTQSQISYPKQSSLTRSNRLHNLNIIQTFLSGIAPPLRPYLDMPRIVKDVASFLIRILPPDFRPVNISLLTNAEKIRLATLVNIHLTYGLEYQEYPTAVADYPEDEERMMNWNRKLKYNPNGSETAMPVAVLTSHQFGLNPPIHRIVHFAGLNSQERNKHNASKAVPAQGPDFDTTTDVVRQIVSTQINAAKVHKIGTKIGELTEQDLRNFSADLTKEGIKPIKSATKGIKEQIAQVRLEHPIIEVDFFGRPIAKKEIKETEQPTTDASDTNKTQMPAHLFYKYHEGKTDAVRRKVLLRDMM